MKLHLSSLALFVFFGAVAISASAQKTETDKYCAYLSELITKAEDHNRKNQIDVGDLLKVADKIFSPLATEGIKQKMKFEDFQAYAKKKGVTVSEFFRPLYLQDYRATACGPGAKTEAGLNIATGSRSILLDKTAVEPKVEFNPSGDPYYHDMKSRKKGKR